MEIERASLIFTTFMIIDQIYLLQYVLCLEQVFTEAHTWIKSVIIPVSYFLSEKTTSIYLCWQLIYLIVLKTKTKKQTKTFHSQIQSTIKTTSKAKMLARTCYTVDVSIWALSMQNRRREEVQFAGRVFLCEVCMFSACLPACVGSLQVPHRPPTLIDKHGSFNWLVLSECGRECLFVAPCDWYVNKVSAGPCLLARDLATTLRPWVTGDRWKDDCCDKRWRKAVLSTDRWGTNYQNLFNIGCIPNPKWFVPHSL